MEKDFRPKRPKQASGAEVREQSEEITSVLNGQNELLPVKRTVKKQKVMATSNSNV